MWSQAPGAFRLRSPKHGLDAVRTERGGVAQWVVGYAVYPTSSWSQLPRHCTAIGHMRPRALQLHALLPIGSR